MSGELKFLLYLALILLVAGGVVLSTSDKLWDDVDHALTPYVDYDKDAHCSATGAGSADPRGIKEINIAWVDGNISIGYAPKTRITWLEKYVQGEPTRDNAHSYWMNTTSIFIDYCSIEKNVMSDNAHQILRKDLTMTIPTSCQLTKLNIKNVEGDISLELPETMSFAVNREKMKGQFTSDFEMHREDTYMVHGTNPTLCIQVRIEKGNLYIHRKAN